MNCRRGRQAEQGRPAGLKIWYHHGRAKAQEGSSTGNGSTRISVPSSSLESKLEPCIDYSSINAEAVRQQQPSTTWQSRNGGGGGGLAGRIAMPGKDCLIVPLPFCKAARARTDGRGAGRQYLADNGCSAAATNATVHYSCCCCSRCCLLLATPATTNNDA